MFMRPAFHIRWPDLQRFFLKAMALCKVLREVVREFVKPKNWCMPCLYKETLHR